jgi:hypothetical protein
MSAHQLLDAAGRPQSPATMPGHHAGRVPPNKVRRFDRRPLVYWRRGYRRLTVESSCWGVELAADRDREPGRATPPTGVLKEAEIRR